MFSWPLGSPFWSSWLQGDLSQIIVPSYNRISSDWTVIKKAENWKRRPSASKQLRSNRSPNADRALACHPITEAICSSIPASNWHGNWLPPRTKSTWTVEHKFVQFEVCLGNRNQVSFNSWFLFIVITENYRNLVEHTQIRRNWDLVWRNYPSMNRFNAFYCKFKTSGYVRFFVATEHH